MRTASHSPRHVVTGIVCACVCCLVWLSAVTAELKPEQAAGMLLSSARRAYNEKNYAFAGARFREFLGRYGNHKDVPSARYGLALCLLDGPDRHDHAAIDQLQGPAGNKEFADQARAIYYLGLAQRGLGLKELVQADARPQESAQRQQAARQRFEQAAKQFEAAVAAFTAKSKEPAGDAKTLPIDQEWIARARCDLAEMQVRA